MNNINKFISGIITEAALDSRIQDGMVNLKNIEHIQVVAEAIYDACEDESIVNEFVDGFVDEGKYPDRQAYNKDGWLVTFPSAEYKQRAIKKGTHHGSDPTHGKGGMNLYYKKRGKQKRQTQQAVTSTEPVQPVQPVQPKQKKVEPDTKKSSNDVPRDEEGNPLYSAVTDDEVNDTGPEPEQTTDKPEPTDTEDSLPSDASQPALTKPTKITPASPAPAQAPAPVPAPNYVSASVKFANSKGWKEVPYGEWHDAMGNTSAIVALSGEVVPVKSVERDELKLIADKNEI